MKNLVCPISDQKVNERVTRLNALAAIATVIAAFSADSLILLVFLMADFFIRAFTGLKYSPISYASHYLTNALGLNPKLTDKAPKVFAARLGFVMATLIVVLFALDYTLAAVIVAGILVVFASLEFAFAICAGCMIYTYLVLPFYRNK